MSFKSYRSYLAEMSQPPAPDEKVTVLYPGGFKPMTGGHLSLIKQYADNEFVDKIRVLVGPGVRDGIDQSMAVAIAEKLTENMPKVEVEASKWPSPVLTSYKIIEEAPPGVYALGSSNKGGDYERTINFTEKHQEGGKFCREDDGVYVVEMPVDVNPLEFVGRTDEHEGEPISASILRDDIVNDDIENFSAGYPNSTPEEINFVWEKLASTVMNEAVYTSGTPTSGTVRNYDRSQPGNFYKNMHGIIPLTEEGEDDELNEGGGAGHMMSPWEATDMTFGEIRQFIWDAMSGKLENVTEKLDGQNIMATFKDGNVYLARSPKHMKNGGELAIRWDDVWDNMYEKTPDHVKEAYTDALTDLQAVFTNSDVDWDKLFKDGHKWMNIELLNPKMENIVPYGDLQLRIHNIREVDDNAKEVDVEWEGKMMDEILKAIDTEDTERVHAIKKTNSVNFEKIDDLENIQEGIIRKMQVLMDTNHLDDDNTIDDYLAAQVRTWVQEHSDYHRFGMDEQLIEDLVQRWGYGNKAKNITKVLKDQPESIKKWVRAQDKKSDEITGKLLDPIIEIFTRVGIAVLQSVSGIAASDPTASAAGIKKKSEDAIKKIKDFMATEDTTSINDFEKKFNYLETQLRRIEQSGGLKGIAPMEGIVFEYKGRLFKLTGNYLPLLKMITFFRFGKDKK